MTRPLVIALAGMTVTCSDTGRFADFLADLWGWEVRSRGALSPDSQSLWRIEPRSAGAAFTIDRSAGAERGMIRIVDGPERKRTHQRTARWDGLEVVVMEDIDGLHEAMTGHAESEPFGPVAQYDFTAQGNNIHRAFSSRLPGGTHVTMTMAVTEPKGRRFHSAKARVGHIFEVPATTPNYRRCRRFYEDTLCMTPTLESSSDDGPMHRACDIEAGSIYWLGILKGGAPGEGLGAIEPHGCDGEYIDSDPADLARFDGSQAFLLHRHVRRTSRNLRRNVGVEGRSDDGLVVVCVGRAIHQRRNSRKFAHLL
jgi:hypothetical protein